MKFDPQEEDDFAPVRRKRRHEPDFWHRLNRVAAALVLLGVFAGVAIMFYPVWRQQQDMRSRIAALEHEKAAKTAQLEQSRREIELLRKDPEYVETIARDRLNLMKPGETIFRVELPLTIGSSVQP
jgi:cell division protein FtsB